MSCSAGILLKLVMGNGERRTENGERGTGNDKIQTFSRRRRRDNPFFLVTTLLNPYILILASS